MVRGVVLEDGVDLFSEEGWLHFPILSKLHDDVVYERFIAIEQLDIVWFKEGEIAEVVELLLLFLYLHVTV